MSLILNVNKDTKKHGVTEFDAFNPYGKEGSGEKGKRGISESEVQYNFMLMKRTFVDGAEEYKLLPKSKKRTKVYIHNKVTGIDEEVLDDDEPITK